MRYWSQWNRTWERTYSVESSQGLEGLHASTKGPLRGKSIQANLLPQHLEDIWDKRVDKQVKCYSICSATNIERSVLFEDTRPLNELAVNTFEGKIIATKIERYLGLLYIYSIISPSTFPKQALLLFL